MKMAHLLTEFPGKPDVVRIKYGDVVTGGGIAPDVSRSRDPTIGLVNHSDGGMTMPKIGIIAIRRAVIDDDDLIRGCFLAQYAGYGVFDKRAGVVCGNDY